ncbi:hypothetical protein F511_13779 [Dorcoceras hygrometricum]|uniref:Uncharacterized protein n=1 Tax=Dorcoceras hygrometricum TaxID=472368 RepID=A0A2Z7B512_9LAMI|nr:hypothetical protein F511_13779 [Dorcoceras hygrometricum]
MHVSRFLTRIWFIFLMCFGHGRFMGLGFESWRFRRKLVQMLILWTPSEQTELFQGTETATAAPTTDKNISDDDSMTLETILSNISDDLSLPSTFGEITPIQLGKSISIPGVDEGDWYKTSLPKINPADKGKTPLQERDPVKENPVKEQFLLIVADMLVQL